MECLQYPEVSYVSIMDERVLNLVINGMPSIHVIGEITYETLFNLF